MASRRQEILDYAKTLAGLPSVNMVTRRLSVILAEPEMSFSNILDIVQYDPGLSSRILSISNSAWHNRGVPVTSLKRAMIALGLDEVRNAITCALFLDGVLRNLGLGKAYILALWKHSLLVAFGGKVLCNQGQDEMEKAFIAGLLHDIGKIPLRMLYRYDQKGKKLGWDDICLDEQERFGIDHQEIGFYLAAEWKLPEEYQQAIRLHHQKRAESSLARLTGNANLLISAVTEDEAVLALRRTVEAEAGKIITLFST